MAKEPSVVASTASATLVIFTKPVSLSVKSIEAAVATRLTAPETEMGSR